MSSRAKRPKVFYGWWVVVSSMLVLFFVSGVISQGFTAIFEPIAKEFGWSYAQVSLGASLRGLEVGLLAPLLGFLVDRWGSRRLVFVGVVLISLGMFCLSRVHSLAAYYWSFVIIACGMSACVGTVFIPTLTHWFRRQLGLAVGLIGSGAGLSGFLVPLVTLLVDKTDWRTALFVMSIVTLVIGIPASLVIRHKPEQYGLLPDGDLEVEQVVTGKTGEKPIKAATFMTTGQALRTPVFWQLAIASTLFAFVTATMMTHIMPYLSSVGITRTFSSMVILVMAIVSVSGRATAGWIGDKLNARWVYIGSLVTMAVGVLFFAYVMPTSLWLLIIFVICYGLGSAGNMTLRPIVLRKYFPSVKFGSILGIADFFMMLGQIGVPVAGWAYDTWATYRGIWLVYVGVIAVGLVVLLSTPKLLQEREARAARQEVEIT